MSKLGNLFNVCGGDGKSCENGTNICSGLHRDDSELIFLIYPDQESLIVVVEDTTTLRPVSVQTAGLKESVSFLEQEVIIDQLFAISFRERIKGVEFAREFSVEFTTSFNNLCLNLVSLISGGSGSEREFSKISSNSNPR